MEFATVNGDKKQNARSRQTKAAGYAGETVNVQQPAPGTGFRGLPTRAGALLFQGKACVLRLLRTLRDGGGRPPRLTRKTCNDPVCAESRTPLYPSQIPEEWALQSGKVQNLRVAARALDGLHLPAGAVFSFWRHIGRATRRRGFVQGRELREGCIIPNVGGGLCQLSNALYDCALQAGCEIVERHAHSRIVPGSSAAAGRDATVFWNYVDLRFRPRQDIGLTVQLSGSELVVHFRAKTSVSVHQPAPDTPAQLPAASCETCGINDCFRHSPAAALPRFAGTVWVVDAFQPEHDTWIQQNRRPVDTFLLPLDGRRRRIAAYRWNSAGFATVREAPLATLRRSWVSRRLAREGATRQRALLAMDAAMAHSLSRRIPPLTTHLVISQNLLPHLWQSGVLGGRHFDVLMTRMPLHELERVLDQAAARHPESRTLADFRAPPEVAQAEAEALAAAGRWITPHAGIAALAGERAELTPWMLPEGKKPRQPGRAIVFPASTLGRKGAYELRDAARELEFTLRLAGPILEGPDFWKGLPCEAAGEDWLDGAAVVALPAWVEHQPRRLLLAAACGVPVVASPACGLHGLAGLVTVPAGDATALSEALAHMGCDFRQPC